MNTTKLPKSSSAVINTHHPEQMTTRMRRNETVTPSAGMILHLSYDCIGFCLLLLTETHTCGWRSIPLCLQNQLKSCPDASLQNSLQMTSPLCALPYLIPLHFAENSPIKLWFCCLSVWFSGLDNEAAGDARIQSGGKSFSHSFFFSPPLSVTRRHTYVGDVQSGVGVKSLDLWPLFGPMRTSTTPGCSPDDSL